MGSPSLTLPPIVTPQGLRARAERTGDAATKAALYAAADVIMRQRDYIASLLLDADRDSVDAELYRSLTAEHRSE